MAALLVQQTPAGGSVRPGRPQGLLSDACSPQVHPQHYLLDSSQSSSSHTPLDRTGTAPSCGRNITSTTLPNHSLFRRHPIRLQRLIPRLLIPGLLVQSAGHNPLHPTQYWQTKSKQEHVLSCLSFSFRPSICPIPLLRMRSLVVRLSVNSPRISIRIAPCRVTPYTVHLK